MADYTLPADQTSPGTLDLSNEANTDGNSTNTNDTIVGSSGNDTIIAGASTEQTYITNPNAPADHQQTGVVQDNDTIVEASGNNTLTGGYGNDHFVFNIGFSETSELQTANFSTAPTQTTGANTNGVWNSYVSNLNEWRAEMDALHGTDTDQTSLTQDYTYSSGKVLKSGEATYDSSYSWYETTTHTNTSTNTITDYGNGHDSIVLAGVTQDQFDSHGGTVTYDAGSNSTTIHIGTFSITVLGANVSENDLTWGVASV